MMGTCLSAMGAGGVMRFSGSILGCLVSSRVPLLPSTAAQKATHCTVLPATGRAGGRAEQS